MKLTSTLLLVATATAATAAAGPPYMFTEYGFDFAGNDIGQVLATKIEDCFKTCTTSPTFKSKCHALSYANGVCYFKTKADPIIAMPGVNSTRVYTDAKPAPCAVIQQNTDYVGNDIGSKPGAVTECCKICQEYPGCRAYAWNNDNGGTCWLKSKRGVVIQKQNVQAGIAYPADTASVSLETDIDFVDHDIGYKPSQTADGCFDICANFTGCRAFTWTNDNGGTCWLKTKRDQVVTKTGAMSGVVTTVKLEKGVDYQGTNLKTTNSATAEACQTLCAQFPGCIVFTWDSSTKNCWIKGTVGTASKHDGVVSGILDPSYPKCAPGSVVEGKDIEGHDLASKSGIPNPDDCPGFCKAAGPDCQAYTWTNYMGGTCWLKTGVQNTITRVGAKSCLKRLG